MNEAEVSARNRQRVGVFALVALIHVAAIFALIRAFAPGAVEAVTRSVLSTFSVTVETPPPPPAEKPKPAPKAAGAEGAAGKKAVPKEVTAPKPKIAIATKPAPQASSTGTANSPGATAGGSGTGAGGQGSGTGAGGSGSGQGGGIAVKPSVRSGEVDDSRDFPVPVGGRQVRFGKSVTVAFTVTREGRATSCSVLRSSVDAAATALVCGLVMRKIRFNPAARADGTTVEARYGYRVDFIEK